LRGQDIDNIEDLRYAELLSKIIDQKLLIKYYDLKKNNIGELSKN
tara:strand:+ start:263 stop:397 length:135 start_codon:yes stop_codon:yes gene_type:complete